MKNRNPIRNFESEFLLAIKNILSIGLVVCEEENVYYFDDNFRNFIKNSGGNLLKRKFDAEIAGTSKRLRFSISFEDENDEPESSDDEVFFFILLFVHIISTYFSRQRDSKSLVYDQFN